MILVLVIVTASLALFLLGCAIRAVGYASQPLHLRWELYPVPHEERERARHGGSYFEETGWQERPRRPRRAGALWCMAVEVLFLRGLWEFNRRLWLRSYPFHVGLYLLTASAAAVLLAALLALHAPGALAASLGWALRAAYTLTGYAGLVLGLLGAAGLLVHRLTDEELAPYTTRGDLVNLAWFIAALGCVLAGALLRGPEHVGAVAFARAVLTFDPAVALPAPLVAGVVLTALLLAYIPCTHMAHFVGKYFLYHAVRWDDEPKLPGNRMETKLAEYLTYRPTWAAAHVGADGKKTWADVATSNPPQGAKP
jgi:nitrate reductase gamma subunit